MTSLEARSWYAEIKRAGNTELRNDFFRLCIDYSIIRARWALWTPEERKEKDPSRSITHDALIAVANSLSRNMNATGEPAVWRLGIGNDRREIGNFACYVACFLGLESA